MKAKLKQKWLRAAERMKAVMEEIGREYPGHNLYVQESTFCLMSGPSHDDRGGYGGNGKARTDRVVEQVTMPHTDCGAW